MKIFIFNESKANGMPSNAYVIVRDVENREEAEECLLRETGKTMEVFQYLAEFDLSIKRPQKVLCRIFHTLTPDGVFAVAN